MAGPSSAVAEQKCFLDGLVSSPFAIRAAYRYQDQWNDVVTRFHVFSLNKCVGLIGSIEVKEEAEYCKVVLLDNADKVVGDGVGDLQDLHDDFEFTLRPNAGLGFSRPNYATATISGNSITYSTGVEDTSGSTLSIQRPSPLGANTEDTNLFKGSHMLSICREEGCLVIRTYNKCFILEAAFALLSALKDFYCFYKMHLEPLPLFLGDVEEKKAMHLTQNITRSLTEIVIRPYCVNFESNGSDTTYVEVLVDNNRIGFVAECSLQQIRIKNQFGVLLFTIDINCQTNQATITSVADRCAVGCFRINAALDLKAKVSGSTNLHFTTIRNGTSQVYPTRADYHNRQCKNNLSLVSALDRNKVYANMSLNDYAVNVTLENPYVNVDVKAMVMVVSTYLAFGHYKLNHQLLPVMEYPYSTM